MVGLERLAALMSAVPPAHLEELTAAFAGRASTAERVAAVLAALKDGGEAWRAEVGDWIAQLLAVEQLVPASAAKWRPVVHDCMSFVASHISDERLAPKIVQQVELPADTPVEERLGLVIARTPGLQKLGQVLARMRRLSPALRKELQKLENGIADVTVAEIRAIVELELGLCIKAYRVELADHLLSEASVSAILEFTWFNQRTGEREEGVFKVIKPHVPVFYAEDLKLLKDLAEHLAENRKDFGFASRAIVDTLEEVRMLLEREVDFRSEQATLAEIARVYPREGAHAPQPIPELCTDIVTAMSLERGVKVTEAFERRPKWRHRAATRIVEALIADPMFSDEEDAVFHADPHAGNLLFDDERDELIILDWALTGRLSREERREVARLIIMMTFRDSSGVRKAIHRLSLSPEAASVIDRSVDEFFAGLPYVCSLGALDAMRLLDRIGMDGVRFPGSLVLIRKVMFTLDGVLHDVAGEDVRLDTVVAREFLLRWVKRVGSLPAPFQLADLVAVQRSVLWYLSGLWAWTN